MAGGAPQGVGKRRANQGVPIGAQKSPNLLFAESLHETEKNGINSGLYLARAPCVLFFMLGLLRIDFWNSFVQSSFIVKMTCERLRNPEHGFPIKNILSQTRCSEHKGEVLGLVCRILVARLSKEANPNSIFLAIMVFACKKKTRMLQSQEALCLVQSS